MLLLFFYSFSYSVSSLNSNFHQTPPNVTSSFQTRLVSPDNSSSNPHCHPGSSLGFLRLWCTPYNAYDSMIEYVLEACVSYITLCSTNLCHNLLFPLSISSYTTWRLIHSFIDPTRSPRRASVPFRSVPAHPRPRVRGQEPRIIPQSWHPTN